MSSPSLHSMQFHIIHWLWWFIKYYTRDIEREERKEQSSDKQHLCSISIQFSCVLTFQCIQSGFVWFKQIELGVFIFHFFRNVIVTAEQTSEVRFNVCMQSTQIGFIVENVNGCQCRWTFEQSKTGNEHILNQFSVSLFCFTFKRIIQVMFTLINCFIINKFLFSFQPFTRNRNAFWMRPVLHCNNAN